MGQVKPSVLPVIANGEEAPEPVIANGEEGPEAVAAWLDYSIHLLLCAFRVQQ